jgi:YbbR domain-containing protein
VIGTTTFWFLNALNKEYTTDLRYPVTFNYDNDSAVLVKDFPEYIEVNVSGGGWELLRKTIWFNKNSLVIPIENPYTTSFISGAQLFALLNEDVDDIILNYMVTDTIDINIQPYFEKSLIAVIDSSKIDIREGYTIISPISIQPDTLIIAGPYNLIDTLDEVYYVSLPITNIDSEINEDIELTYYDPDLVHFYPPEINVQFEVARFINASAEVNIEMVNFPEDSSAYIDPIKAIIQFEIVEFYERRYNPLDFLVIADYTNIITEDSTLALEIVQTPQYVRNYILDSTRVKVIYEK